jgi:hypothetical protein
MAAKRRDPLDVDPSDVATSVGDDGSVVALIDSDAGRALWREVRDRLDAQSEAVKAAKDATAWVKALMGDASSLVTLDGAAIAVYGSRKGRRVDRARLKAETGIDLADYEDEYDIATLTVAKQL